MEAQGSTAKCKVRQTWRRLRGGTKKKDQLGVKLAGEIGEEGAWRGSYRRRRKAASGRSEGALPEWVALNPDRHTPCPRRPR